MYNKFLNCLEDMGYEYRELERVHFAKSDVTAYNVIEVHNSFKNLYFEFTEYGDVYTWSSDGRPLGYTMNNDDYIMAFRLSWILQRAFKVTYES